MEKTETTKKPLFGGKRPTPIKFRMTERRKKFVAAYLTTAHGVASKAAREAGFRCPGSIGPKLVKQLAHVIEEKRHEQDIKAKAGAEEIQQRLSELARDPDHKDHFKALELMAKIHGLLSEKIDITLSRKELKDNVSAAMGQLAALTSRKALLEKSNSAPAKGA